MSKQDDLLAYFRDWVASGNQLGEDEFRNALLRGGVAESVILQVFNAYTSSKKGAFDYAEFVKWLYTESAEGGDANTASYTVEDIKEEVQNAWNEIHTRDDCLLGHDVPRQAFLDQCLKEAAIAGDQVKDYREYVNCLMDVGAAMSLPSVKTELSKHEFSYCYILRNEFYADDPDDYVQIRATASPKGEAIELRDEVSADWNAVSKDGDGRVGLDVFKKYFLEKHKDKISAQMVVSYKTYLEAVFKACCAMMTPVKNTRPPWKNRTLSDHCFRYGALMAGEFHFESGMDTRDDSARTGRRSITATAGTWRDILKLAD